MSDYLRFRRRTLQTPVHRYVHPESGRRITLVGAMHFGEASYYHGLLNTVDEAEAAGAVVHCEGSSMLPYDEQDLTDDELAALDMQDRAGELEKRGITALGWVSQRAALGYPDRWQVIDLNTVDLIRAVGWRWMLDASMRTIKMFDWPDRDIRKVEEFRLALYAGFSALRFSAWTSALRARCHVKSRSVDAVLVDQRDAVALDGLWGTDRDTVLIWGCAHLPGLAAGIRRRGYVRDGVTEWHTAATLPPARSTLAYLKTLPRVAAVAPAPVHPDIASHGPDDAAHPVEPGHRYQESASPHETRTTGDRVR